MNATANTLTLTRTEVPRCDLDGETVLFSPLDGSYFGLNAVSSRIWDLLETPTTLTAICAALGKEFDVDPTVCEEQTVAFLSRLEAAGLLRRA